MNFDNWYKVEDYNAGLVKNDQVDPTKKRITEEQKKNLIRFGWEESSEDDPVDHPRHYTSHPSGVECIQITEHMNFNLGNALKYIWRADLKDDAIEDLKKSEFYIKREIRRRGG